MIPLAHCVTCRGPRALLPERLERALADPYPQDRATGFEMGDLRGWFWVEVPPPAEAPPAPAPAPAPAPG